MPTPIVSITVSLTALVLSNVSAVPIDTPKLPLDYSGRVPSIAIDYYDACPLNHPNAKYKGGVVTDYKVETCHPTSPISNTMYINWAVGFHKITLYEDGNCNDEVKVVFRPKHPDKSNTGCFGLLKSLKYRSFKGHSYKVDNMIRSISARESNSTVRTLPKRFGTHPQTGTLTLFDQTFLSGKVEHETTISHGDQACHTFKLTQKYVDISAPNSENVVLYTDESCHGPHKTYYGSPRTSTYYERASKIGKVRSVKQDIKSKKVRDLEVTSNSTVHTSTDSHIKRPYLKAFDLVNQIEKNIHIVTLGDKKCHTLRPKQKQVDLKNIPADEVVVFYVGGECQKIDSIYKATGLYQLQHDWSDYMGKLISMELRPVSKISRDIESAFNVTVQTKVPHIHQPFVKFYDTVQYHDTNVKNIALGDKKCHKLKLTQKHVGIEVIPTNEAVDFYTDDNCRNLKKEFNYGNLDDLPREWAKVVGKIKGVQMRSRYMESRSLEKPSLNSTIHFSKPKHGGSLEFYDFSSSSQKVNVHNVQLGDQKCHSFKIAQKILAVTMPTDGKNIYVFSDN